MSQQIVFDIANLFRDVHATGVNGVIIPYPGYNGIADVIEEALGIKRFPDIPTEEQDPAQITYTDVPKAEPEQAHGTTYLGTPYWFPITFLAKSRGYWKYDNGKLYRDTGMADFRLPLTSICKFSRQKDITRTRVNGDGGGVTEIFGFMPWQITIQGVILPEPNQPQGKTSIRDVIEELVSWDDVVDGIEVLGHQFAMRGIDMITIDEIQIDQERGRKGMVPYTIYASSEKTFEITAQ